MRPLSFQFCSARQRGISVYVCVAAENTPRGLRSNEIGAPLHFACGDMIARAKCVFECLFAAHAMQMYLVITSSNNVNMNN